MFWKIGVRPTRRTNSKLKTQELKIVYAIPARGAESPEYSKEIQSLIYIFQLLILNQLSVLSFHLAALGKF